ncbi:unnamed protein product, partial [Mesorhabditis spiculigera]
MYVGGKEITEKNSWVLEGDRMVQKLIRYSPALLKVFDEILINAADNKQRAPEMDTIRVTIDRKSGTISVWNNGTGIPIREHPKEHVPIPTLIFGYPMVSSHLDDSKTRIVGGRNGYGAKACNILSSSFKVRTGSRADQKLFEQTWTDNMANREEFKLSKYDGEDFTEVIFTPDYAWFGVPGLDADMIALLHKRVLDLAATLNGVKVYYNGLRVEFVNYCWRIGQFSSYWHVIVGSSTKGKALQQISFVNNVHTSKGGRHLDYVLNQIVDAVQQRLAELGHPKIRPSEIKPHFIVFINCLIENPSFQAQTKEELTTTPKHFGSSFELDVKKLQQWAEEAGILEEILSNTKANNRPKRKLATAEVEKLIDANWAGKKRRDECTLIITEGDSAKAFAMAGLEAKGRDRFGILPIRGKLLNVQDAAEARVFANKEILALCAALNLDKNRTYETQADLDSLRYGKLMLLADQDDDGARVKGLVINFIGHFWPALLRTGFLSSFVTALIKARRGAEVMNFFSQSEFRGWFDRQPDAHKWKIKYYKGLGTSTSQEALEYFRNLEQHVVPFRWSAGDDEQLQMAFDPGKSAARRGWYQRRNTQLAEQGDDVKVLRSSDGITYSEFVDQELFRYTLLSIRRHIPSVMDGLKPSQRKVLYTCLSQSRDAESKVSQLASAVALAQSYHHAEASLEGTIVRLAQDFVGANNVPLLLPIGQFGTRFTGGEDAASSRYIYTKLSPVTRLLFPAQDEPSLEFVVEEGQRAEPKWLCPVVPTVLLNGCEGLATGWSSSVPPYNPSDVIGNVRRLIQGKPTHKMIPHFRGFTGGIVAEEEPNSYKVQGVIRVLKIHGPERTRICITELPARVWTEDYRREVIVALQKEGVIKDLSEQHTENKVHFEFDLIHPPLLPANLRIAGMGARFLADPQLRMARTLRTSNMVLHDPATLIKHYQSTDDIFADHFAVRHRLYKERKAREMAGIEAKVTVARNQHRFMADVIEGRLQPNDDEIVCRLVERGYDSDPRRIGKNPEYDYLIDVPIRRLRRGEMSKLEADIRHLETRLQATQCRTVIQMWSSDLDIVEQVVFC